MSKKKSNPNYIKNFITIVAVLGGLIVVLKKISKFLKQLDNDDFKWEAGLRNFGDVDNKSASRTVTPKPVVPKTKTPKQKARKVTPQVEILKRSSVFDLTERQESIYDIIKSTEKATMQDISEGVPEVSNRTLRRDMNKLENLGLVQRNGKTKNSVYRLKE